MVSNSIQAIIFNTPPRIIDFSVRFSTVTLSFVSMMLLTYFLAVFLLALKRLAEKLWIKNAEKSRPVLAKYSTTSLKVIALLGFLMSSGSFFLLTYSLKILLAFLTPYAIGLMWWYYKLTFKKDSPVKNPEEVFTKNKIFIGAGCGFLLLMCILLFV